MISSTAVTLIVIFSFLLCTAPFLFGSPPEDNDLNLVRVTEAIRTVENWDGKSVGKSGELGPYQILPSVWKQFSQKPLSWAYSEFPEAKAEQTRVANALVSWIFLRLPLLNYKRSAYSIGLVYCAGYENARNNTISRAKHDYADRVYNVYRELNEEALA